MISMAEKILGTKVKSSLAIKQKNTSARARKWGRVYLHDCSLRHIELESKAELMV